jgi:hypothetical protein
MITSYPVEIRHTNEVGPSTNTKEIFKAVKTNLFNPLAPEFSFKF